jgi:DNA-binding NtrC family response regulator
MASKRVLIVDDEENIGRSLRMILEREGYAVSVCRSAAEFRTPTPTAPMPTCSI